MFVFYEWRYGSNADAHGSDEDKGIVFSPQLAYISTFDGFSAIGALQFAGDIGSSLANLYDGYLLHFSISMGL